MLRYLVVACALLAAPPACAETIRDSDLGMTIMPSAGKPLNHFALYSIEVRCAPGAPLPMPANSIWVRSTKRRSG
jgi:hypothetical protein